MNGDATIRPLIERVGDAAAFCDPASDFCDVPTTAAELVPTDTSASPAARSAR